MQTPQVRQHEHTEALPLPAQWWLLPSALCGAVIWAVIIAALVG